MGLRIGTNMVDGCSFEVARLHQKMAKNCIKNALGLVKLGNTQMAKDYVFLAQKHLNACSVDDGDLDQDLLTLSDFDNAAIYSL
jgi:hypothetical protein